MITRDTALIIVDMQNDFALPGGALYVPGGETLSDPIAKFMEDFSVVVATQDWHPSNHSSFHNPWPVHCVSGTWGAQLVDPRVEDRADMILRKGSNPKVDSYSAFKDESGVETGLAGFLFARRIRRVYLVGLARDYCVKATALHAMGLDPHVVWDLTKSVDKENDNSVLLDLKKNSVKIV